MVPSRELQRRISDDQDMPAPPKSLGGFRGIRSTLLWTSSPVLLARARLSDEPQAAKADTANTAVRLYRVISCILRIGRCALVAAVPLMPAARPATATSAIQLADGTWLVQARVDSGRRYCTDRLVLLTNRQGQLSGSVAFARASAPINNLVLQPNGSFSGATRGGVTGSKLGRFYKVTGQFSGDTVSVTVEGTGCPPRHGTATRCVTSG
jgi:hypothetical protein